MLAMLSCQSSYLSARRKRVNPKIPRAIRIIDKVAKSGKKSTFSRPESSVYRVCVRGGPILFFGDSADYAPGNEVCASTSRFSVPRRLCVYYCGNFRGEICCDQLPVGRGHSGGFLHWRH